MSARLLTQDLQLHLAEESKASAILERRRAEEDSTTLRTRNEQLVEKLRGTLYNAPSDKGRYYQRDRDRDIRSRASTEFESSYPSYASVQSTSDVSLRRSCYELVADASQPKYAPSTSSSARPLVASSSQRYQQRAASPSYPHGQQSAWYPPSPRKTTSRTSPHLNNAYSRASPTKNRPGYTHVRSSGTITAIVPLQATVKEEDDEDHRRRLLLDPVTPSSVRHKIREFERATDERPRGREQERRRGKSKSMRAAEDDAAFMDEDEDQRRDVSTRRKSLNLNDEEREAYIRSGRLPSRNRERTTAQEEDEDEDVDEEDEISGWKQDDDVSTYYLICLVNVFELTCLYEDSPTATYWWTLSSEAEEVGRLQGGNARLLHR